MRKFERRDNKPLTVERANVVFGIFADVYKRHLSLGGAAKFFRCLETQQTLRDLTDRGIDLLNGPGDSLVNHVYHMELSRKIAWRIASVINRPDMDILIPELLNIIESLKTGEKFTVGEMVLTASDKLFLTGLLYTDHQRKEMIIDDYAELRIEEGLIDPFNEECNPGMFRILTRRKVASYKESLSGNGSASMDVMQEFTDIKLIFSRLSAGVFEVNEVYEVMDLLPQDLSNYEIRFLFKEVFPLYYKADELDPRKKIIFDRLEKLLELRDFVYFGPTEKELRDFLIKEIGDKSDVEIDQEFFGSSVFIKKGLMNGQENPLFDRMVKLFRIELFKKIKGHGRNL